jgi:hypothetical protein
LAAEKLLLAELSSVMRDYLLFVNGCYCLVRDTNYLLLFSLYVGKVYHLGSVSVALVCFACVWVVQGVYSVTFWCTDVMQRK